MNHHNEPLVQRPLNQEITRGYVRIHQVVLNADCRYQLPGLTLLAQKLGCPVDEKGPGQLIVFINTKRDFIKVLLCNGTPFPVLAQYRLPEGRIYDLRVVAEIPKAMNVRGQIDFDKALEEALKKKFGHRRAASETHAEILRRTT